MQGGLEEGEECTCRCIAELHVAVLEMLLQHFWEGEGLQTAAPLLVLCFSLMWEAGGDTQEPPQQFIC